MTLDEQVLAEAKRCAAALVDLETQTAHARVDYHHAIKKLHAAGGSLREIAEALELSHQRVHQIVEGPLGVPGPPFGRRGWQARPPGRGGRSREFFMARFDDGAKEVMVEAQKEADSLKHNYVGTEHLMLAVVKRGVEGSTTTRRARRSPSGSARATSRGSRACRGRSRRARSGCSRPR